MKKPPYNREQGDFELRILKDGRLVLIGPDEALLDVAQAFADLRGKRGKRGHSTFPPAGGVREQEDEEK